MKKSLIATIIVGGFLTMSLVYADDYPNAGAVSGTGAINNGASGTTANTPNGTGAIQDSSSSDTSSIDQGMSDTATGDDDY